MIEKDGQEVAMIFRNHFISDQVGFVYYRWSIADSLNDFACHLNNIRISLPEDGRNYLLPVILDGENAWEYYPNGGKEWLEAFYGRLQSDPQIRTVRVADYLAENPPQRKLTKLFAGSWIDNNFKIWIGHQEDNTAWDYLHKARLALAGATEGDLAKAWQEIYIAEGSDWCWWYGDDHSSENDPVFDSLFRKHLKNVYSLINRTPPKYLDTPIKMTPVIKPVKEPVYLIQPILDGEISNYYEWLPAGIFDITKAKGAMHQIETLLRDIYYGFSRTDLFIRLGVNLGALNDELKQFSFAVIIQAPAERKFELTFSSEADRYVFRSAGLQLESFGVGRIIELGIPFSQLGAAAGQTVEFVIVVSKDGQELERWPKGGGITITVPTEAYEQEQWYV